MELVIRGIPRAILFKIARKLRSECRRDKAKERNDTSDRSSYLIFHKSRLVFSFIFHRRGLFSVSFFSSRFSIGLSKHVGITAVCVFRAINGLDKIQQEHQSEILENHFAGVSAPIASRNSFYSVLVPVSTHVGTCSPVQIVRFRQIVERTLR